MKAQCKLWDCKLCKISSKKALVLVLYQCFYHIQIEAHKKPFIPSQTNGPRSLVLCQWFTENGIDFPKFF